MSHLSLVDGDIPESFLCPIGMELMTDPVVCADGHTYERINIENWLLRSHRSPKTNLELGGTMLIPNHTLRGAIADWMEERDERAAKAAAAEIENLPPIPPSAAGGPSLSRTPSTSQELFDAALEPVDYLPDRFHPERAAVDSALESMLRSFANQGDLFSSDRFAGCCTALFSKPTARLQQYLWQRSGANCAPWAIYLKPCIDADEPPISFSARMNDTTISFIEDPGLTVAQLKDKMTTKLDSLGQHGIEPDTQKWMFNGRLLADEATLDLVGVKDGDCLVVMHQQVKAGNGGGSIGIGRIDSRCVRPRVLRFPSQLDAYQRAGVHGISASLGYARLMIFSFKQDTNTSLYLCVCT
jgi:hypothetical protein